ncbi:hypothetical protein PHYBLDRAFT_138434 [Phycomyces blakesleeanus NRRL 1555(-)]|uniref:Uncharacterized protein n=1 Tax=Phycomyces blakesleeanus (strain ATCC 8743b / DSM 1359 / FGSC 10004 / NBRC 33097 / NRRL 1555) TaxID=763407 RepID=A0A163EQM6_PHYB8|nr:hypothetical protein PHYBLDRAFT_138434 [Phycomyces blakesleeanus NRRL 1555(-)]OAD80880.1 hypothetical protein PHYBLDRAFT_138434 [Phycomyces blakesleeanus NRRL 1555(-)]|eukprot:XP_018298920.1 hypothetical protein PHYBLDRAFT_138434 [Phycomyces blakesleeanus NRRL 1555(-)]
MSVPPFVDSSLNLKTILVPDTFSLETDDRLVCKVCDTFSQARNYIGHFFQQIDSGRMVLCPWFISCLEHQPSTDTPSPDLSSLLSLVQLDSSSLGKASTGSLQCYLYPQSGGKCFGIERQPKNVSTYLYLDASPAHLASFVKMLLKISITFSLAVLSNARCGTSFSLAFAWPGTLLKSVFSLPEAASYDISLIKAFGFSFPLSLLKRFGVLIGNLFLMTNPFCQFLLGCNDDDAQNDIVNRYVYIINPFKIGWLQKATNCKKPTQLMGKSNGNGLVVRTNVAKEGYN